MIPAERAVVRLGVEPVELGLAGQQVERSGPFVASVRELAKR
jgi:hypothetical protein